MVDHQLVQMLTLPNSPNWDSEIPASFLSQTLAFCANASVHVLDLTDSGFVYRQTVGLGAKFKKQFCRCTTVLLLSKTSMLVSLDKRTIVWEQNFQTTKSTTVSVGDVVIQMALQEKMSSGVTKVIALTKQGQIYRLTLSEQRGITLELVFKEEAQTSISASEIRVNGQQILVLYGTEDGRVNKIDIDREGLVTRDVIGSFQKGVRVSGVLALDQYLLATGKDGSIILKKKEGELTIMKMLSSIDDNEESKSSKKAAPKNLESYRLLELADNRVLISGVDGALNMLDLSQCKDQETFEKGIKLVSDSGHNMPILQLLKDQTCSEQNFLSLGYDRSITVWQTQGDYIDQITRISCLGQTIDKGMLAFTNPDELIIVQNRASCQKVLSLELQDSEQVILTNDLTSSKILDRSAQITAFAIEDHMMAFVYDESRLSVYDSLQKELIKKYRPSSLGKIKELSLNRDAIYLLVVVNNDTCVELQKLSLRTGTLTKLWQQQRQNKIVSGKVYMCEDADKLIICIHEENRICQTALISLGKDVIFYQGYEVLCIATDAKLISYSSQNWSLVMSSTETGNIELEARLTFDLKPLLTCLLSEINQLAVVCQEKTNELLLISLTDLTLLRKVSLMELLAVSSIFSGKATSMIANSSKLIIACEDKCLRVVPLCCLDKVGNLLLNSSKQSKKSKQTDGKAEKRQKVDNVKPQLQTKEKTLFSIVRSRVFFQQKTAETLHVIEQLDRIPQEGEDVPLDLKLLLFSSQDATKNLKEAIEVIQTELQTCVFVQKFEYFQKLIVLSLWLVKAADTEITIEKVAELIKMHLPNLQQDPNITEAYISALKSCLEISKDGEALPTNDFLHLSQAKKILQSSEKEAVIQKYLARGCFVEAIVLAKFWHDQTAFVRTLRELFEQLQKENKIQQMAKVSKALEKIQGQNAEAQEQNFSTKENFRSLISNF